MKLALSLAFAAGVFFAGAMSADAAVAPPVPTNHASLIQVRDGCGRGYHRNPRGECRPDRFDDGDHGGWHDGDRGDRWGWCGRHHHRNRWGRCVPNW